ncbi:MULTISPECIES: SRPBCC family protein [unclassified Brachybacterium]|uniref:SRPBCC family protein n=1 Tax=unclassified Brachybacterium TaxID=2623841 RepID=UPI003F922ADF
MSRPLHVSDSVEVAADPMTIYREVADPSQMGRWSPENQGTTEPGHGPLTVGDEFVGRNRRGPGRWSTACTVIAAEPGERFAFRVHRIGVRRPVLRGGIATWTYTFEPADEGRTRVTETWQDDRTRWPDAVAARFDKLVTGGRTFDEFQAGNIRRTLARLKADLEG